MVPMKITTEMEKLMDIAVIADIHSNYIALEHCMNHALKRGIRTFIFLGDYIGEMAYPERTMARLDRYRRKYDCRFIRGNKEKYWLDYRNNGECGWLEYNSTSGALYYAYRALNRKDLDFFENLPITDTYTFPGLPAITVCHGSPRNEREHLILDEPLTKEILEQSEADYILCAHTHIQAKFTLPATDTHRKKTVLNPGSAGLPLDSEAPAQFMILHGEDNKWTEEFIQLGYDVEEVIEQLETSGLAARAPYWCKITADLLRYKEKCPYGHADVLERAMELCYQETGACNWPNIPERFWEAAMKAFPMFA